MRALEGRQAPEHLHLIKFNEFGNRLTPLAEGAWAAERPVSAGLARA